MFGDEKSFTAEQVVEMQMQMMAEFKESLVAFARELKAPDEETAAKNAEIKARKMATDARQAKDAVERQKRIEEAQANCTHRKENGKWNTSGILNADGLVTLICQRCFKVWRIKVSPDNARLIDAGDLELAEQAPPAQAAA